LTKSSVTARSSSLPPFHSLRHSHGSALIAAGWDIEDVSARLGHANIATTHILAHKQTRDCLRQERCDLLELGAR
jgi:site-specific recombinase XerD